MGRLVQAGEPAAQVGPEQKLEPLGQPRGARRRALTGLEAQQFQGLASVFRANDLQRQEAHQCGIRILGHGIGKLMKGRHRHRA